MGETSKPQTFDCMPKVDGETYPTRHMDDACHVMTSELYRNGFTQPAIAQGLYEAEARGRNELKTFLRAWVQKESFQHNYHGADVVYADDLLRELEET